MPETKTKVALERQGWKIGDRAFSGSATFGDENDPSLSSYVVGIFRSKAAAKRAVATEVQKRMATEKRDGWWGGDVEEGWIADESFDDNGRGGVGWVEDWTFERDERKPVAWMHAGLAWNE